MTRIVQFIATDSPVDRLGQILESRLWVKNHLRKTFTVNEAKFRDFNGYWNALSDYWTEDEDLICIEQDMLPLERHIQGLMDCPADFCTVPYDLGDGRLSIFEIHEGLKDATGPTGDVGFDVPRISNHTRRVTNSTGSGLGLVKFSKRAKTLINLDDYPVPQRHWSLIDLWISKSMDMIHERWHVHYPEVGHLHFRY